MTATKNDEPSRAESKTDDRAGRGRNSTGISALHGKGPSISYSFRKGSVTKREMPEQACGRVRRGGQAKTTSTDHHGPSKHPQRLKD